ncbi:hypothetical protein [Absidia glauca]|uniref:Wilms tumor protein homolog n=1 Tax=Absidia glauca TaxID=4829 RepID=A0A163JH39_ABSGL|nr:hypothetical protein [Absidia glauca]
MFFYPLHDQPNQTPIFQGIPDFGGFSNSDILGPSFINQASFDQQLSLMNHNFLQNLFDINIPAFVFPPAFPLAFPFLPKPSDDAPPMFGSSGFLPSPSPLTHADTNGPSQSAPSIITTVGMERAKKRKISNQTSDTIAIPSTRSTKSFYCEHEGCNRVFSRKYNLISHSATHSTERKYACSDCTKAFVRRHDLKRHSRTHTGETPHQCRYCLLGYGRSDALQRHYIVSAECALKLQDDPTNPLHFRRKRKATGSGLRPTPM